LLSSLCLPLNDSMSTVNWYKVAAVCKDLVHAKVGLMCVGSIHGVLTKDHHKHMARSDVYVGTTDIAVIAKFIKFCYILPLMWDFNWTKSTIGHDP
jgi:hypothetical protein